MTILDDLRELLGDDKPLDEVLKTLAEGIAAFYKTLIGEGVPEEEAADMTSSLIVAVCGR